MRERGIIFCRWEGWRRLRRKRRRRSMRVMGATADEGGRERARKRLGDQKRRHQKEIADE